MAADPYMSIPVSEFEFLHAEIKRLREGWSDAEAQIAALQVLVTDLRTENARLARALSHS